jgi:Na+/H+-translocating membrane pyrophosphatase
VIVSELVVVIAVCGLSLVLTGLHARSLSRFAASPHDLERMLAAVQRACADFLWHETRLLALLIGIVLVVVALPVAAFGAAGAGHALAWSLAASSVGAMAGAGVAHLAHWSAARTAHASLGALRHDRNAATGVALRGASMLAVSIDATCSALAACAFVAHYAFLTKLGQVPSDEALVLASRTLAALAFGALCAAVVFHVGGSSLHTAAGVAATSARSRDPRIAHDEEQNPVLVAELVGDHVGGIVSRATDVFAGLLLANAGVCMLAALVSQANRGSGGGVRAGLGLLALPVVIRAVGQFAASVALASSRFEGQVGTSRVGTSRVGTSRVGTSRVGTSGVSTSGVSTSGVSTSGVALSGTLVAARIGHAVLQAAGVFGATSWLLGTTVGSEWALAGALGVLAGVLSALVAVMGLRERRPNPLAGSRSGPTLARAFGMGLQRTWVSCALVGACLGGAWTIGAHTTLVHGGAFALTLAVAALLGAAAFDASESIFAALVENVHRVATLRRSRFDDAARQRASEMARAGVAIGHLGRTQTILGGSAAALLAAVLLPLSSSGASAGASGLGWAHPIVLLGGVLGAGSLSFHVGGMLKASSRTAASLDKDLSERFTHDSFTHASVTHAGVKHASGADASGPLPGYRDSVQLAATSSTQALLPLALGAVLAPFLVASSLRLIYGAAGGPMIAYGLMALSTLAALTGCSAALVAQGTSLELADARRAGAESASNPHSIIEFLERCIGPAALLGLKATVVSSLAAVPLLI